MRKIVAIFLLLFTLQADDKYQLGEGIQVGSLALYLGGYFSLDYKYMDDYQRYRVDDLAFLAYGSYSKFSYLVELEYKELYVKINDNGEESITKDTNLYTERIYMDYNLDENYMLRVGKYNSPIGFWNLLPINVLRETTSSPKSSYIVFPKFTTGLGASYSSYDEGEFKIDLMLQHNNNLDDDTYNNYTIDQHYALGITYEKSDFTYKLNVGFFHPLEQMSGDDLFYLLLSTKYESDSYQFLGEIGTQKSENEVTTEYAGYIQGLYRFAPEHTGVLRLESYDDRRSDTSDDIAIVGYTYRPLYPIALKSEYQFHTLKSENQLLFSFSVLF